jgi:hypothetical protein
LILSAFRQHLSAPPGTLPPAAWAMNNLISLFNRMQHLDYSPGHAPLRGHAESSFFHPGLFPSMFD